MDRKARYCVYANDARALRQPRELYSFAHAKYGQAFGSQERLILSFERQLAPAQRYERGEYVFYFEIPLSPGLPSSVHARESHIGDMRNVRASVVYEIEAFLPLCSFFALDLNAKKRFQVESKLKITPVPHRVCQTREISLVGVFDKGPCTVTANLTSNVLRVGHEAEIHCVIENNSTRKVHNVRVELFQRVHVPSGEYGESCVLHHNYKVEVDPGEKQKCVLRPKITAIESLAATSVACLFAVTYSYALWSRSRCAPTSQWGL